MADAEWERYKAEIIQLYLHEGGKGKPLNAVVTDFKKKYGFCKTASQYRTQLNKWGIKKNQPGDIWKFVDRRVRKRAREGSDSDVYVRKKFVSEDKRKKEIARHVPLCYEYTCGSEPQTPEGVIVCTPGAEVFSLGQGKLRPLDVETDHSDNSTCPVFPECETVGEIPAAAPIIVYSTASQALESLPYFQFQNQFLTWFGLEVQQALDTLILPLDAILPFGAEGTFPLDGRLVGFTPPRTLDLIHSTSEKSIQDARRLLLECLKENSNLDCTTDNANAIASLLESVMVEQSEGDLARGAKTLFGPSKPETLLHIFQYYVYLLSNNMMPDLQTRKFLRWLTENGFRYLLKEMLQSNSTTVEIFASKLLLAAVGEDDVETVRILLEAGVDTDVPRCSYPRRTPPQEVIRFRNTRLVKMLFNAGANPNGLENGDPLLQDSDMYLSQALYMAQLLVNAGADPDPSTSPAMYIPLQPAITSNTPSVLEFLLNARTDPNHFPSNTALLVAIMKKNSRLDRFLLQKKADINAFAGRLYGSAALQVAARHGSLRMITELLEAGADINAPAALLGGETALEAAVHTQNNMAAKLLLDRGAKLITARAKGILDLAVRYRSIDESLVEMLIKAGADVNPRIDHGSEIPLGGAVLYNAVRNGSLNVVQMCLKAGANVNSRSKDWRGNVITALQAAVERQHIGIVQALIDGGAGMSGEVWATSLRTAVSSGNIDIIQLLLKHGADMNPSTYMADGATVLQTAVSRGNIDVVQLLLKHGADTNSPRSAKKGMTSLQSAVSKGNIDIIRLLLNHGADVNAPGSPRNGRTALQMAAIRGSVRVVKLLLQHAADVNAPACHDGGVTALQGAAIAGNMRAMLVLLAAGADIDAAPARVNGRLAIEGAAEHGRLDALHILLNCHPDTEDFELKKEKAANLAARNGHFAITRFIKAHRKGGLFPAA